MNATLAPTTPVTPAKAGAWLFLSTLSPWGEVAKGSQTPDQVRGDDGGKDVLFRVSATPREAKIMRLPPKKMFTRRRGGAESLGFAPYATPVTLNSFQGPFLAAARSAVGQQGRAVYSSPCEAGRSARWMLKQVQHDDVVREAAE